MQGRAEGGNPLPARFPDEPDDISVNRNRQVKMLTGARLCYRPGMASGLRSEGLGKRLFEARQESGMTLKALSERANVGLSTISDVERGHYIPAGDAIERLANALGVSPCWLAYGLGSKQADT